MKKVLIAMLVLMNVLITLAVGLNSLDFVSVLAYAILSGAITIIALIINWQKK